MAKFDDYLRTAGSFVGNILYRGVSVAKALKPSDGKVINLCANPIEFTYVGTDGEEDYKSTMFYTDTYFDVPSTEYNGCLATASIAVAMACGNSVAGYEVGYRNVEALMKDMGFSGISHNEAYESISSLDTIGVAIAHRNIGGFTLLCIGIRGIGYGSEWGANLLLGTGTYHQGFDEASNRVLDYIRSYIDENEICGKLKMWMTGYSRSASVTNLVAGKIDTAIADGNLSEVFGNNIEIGTNDVYAYCFEPAMTVKADALDIHGPAYSNIWNHINPNDPIPIMVTSGFGMERFGTDLKFPDSSDYNYRGRKDRMLEFYRRLPNREQIGIYRTDFFKAINVRSLGDDGPKRSWKTQADFLKDMNSRFVEYLESREFYVENIQSGLSKFVAKRNSYEGSDKFKACLRKALGENKLPLIAAINSLEKDDLEGLKYSMGKPVYEALVEAGMDVSLTEEMTCAVSELMMLFRDFVKDNKLMTFNFLFNMRTIFFAHYPELIYSWLMSLDPNYDIS